MYPLTTSSPRWTILGKSTTHCGKFHAVETNLQNISRRYAKQIESRQEVTKIKLTPPPNTLKIPFSQMTYLLM